MKNNKRKIDDVQSYRKWAANKYKKFEAEQMSIEKLPTEILNLILIRLSISDVLAVARVCKTWNKITTSDKFWFNNFRFYFPTTFNKMVIDGNITKEEMKQPGFWLKQFQGYEHNNFDLKRMIGPLIYIPIVEGCTPDLMKKLFRLSMEGNLNGLLSFRELEIFKNFKLFRLLQAGRRGIYAPFTPLEIIIQFHHQHILDFLYKEMVEWYDNDCTIMKLVDRYGAEPIIEGYNDKNYKASLLYWAVKFNQVQEIPSLINRGADIEQAMQDSTFVVNKTHLLQEALICHHLELAKLLITHQADYKEEYNEYHSWHNCLHLSSILGQREMVEFFLDQGMDVNLRSGDDKTTPLHSAIENHYLNPANIGKLETINLLLDKGADVNIEDAFGRSPLMIKEYSCQFFANKYDKAVLSLLNKGKEEPKTQATLTC